MAFYNIFIEHKGNERQYIIALDQKQLDTLVAAYLNGESAVLIKGKKRNIYLPEALIIYSADKWEGSQSDLETEMQRQALFSNSKKISLGTFKKYGTNITDQITGGLGWGAKREDQVPVPEKTFKPAIGSKPGKIFISHAVKDAEIVRAFTEDILQVALGVLPSKEVFNISIEDSGIKTGEDFRQKIAGELKAAKAVILIITENYKKSEACLNEMGAAWMLDVPVIPFILEPISYSTVGFIHTPNQLLKLNKLEDLKKFVSENKSRLFKADYDDTKLDRKIEEFLQVVKNVASGAANAEVQSNKSIQVSETKAENPFFKINNHSNLYYLENGKYREIPDSFTQILLGYRAWKGYSEISIPVNKLSDHLGKPMQSVLDCEIYKTDDDPACWIIYERFRHHILNGESLDKLLTTKKVHRAVINVPKGTLHDYHQGDSFNLV